MRKISEKKKSEKTKNFYKVIIVIILLYISWVLTEETIELVPDVATYSQSFEFEVNKDAIYDFDGINYNFFKVGQSELHHYCPQRYNSSVLLKGPIDFEETSLRRGDPFAITFNLNIVADRTCKKYEQFAGVNENRLKKVKEGINELE